MSVPFEQLGPGQVGRLAYQVIGKDGPIFNPSNIRFLPPPSGGGSELSSYAELTTGLAGVNLLLSAGTLALSAATLNEVRKLQRKVDAVLFGIEQMKSTLGDLSRKVDRIDMRVAENNLRESMRHVFARALRADEIGSPLRSSKRFRGSV